MRILVAVSAQTDDECADPISLIASFPWPPDSIFQTISIAEFIHPPPVVPGVPGSADFPEIQQKVDSAAEDMAAAGAARLREHGFRAESFAAEGNPKELIPEHAREWQADLIVVGACRRSRLEKFLLGSVSESVVAHAPCSVLVARPAGLRE